MEQFYGELADKIKKAVETDMQKILEEVGDESIYTAALVTDSDCITLFLAVNTLEYLEENGGMEEDYYKWTPDEWGYSDDINGPDGALAKLSTLLYEHDVIQREIDENDMDEKREENRHLFFEAVISALRQLKEEKIFGNHSQDVLCFASVSDDDQAEEIENQSAEQLNDPKLAEAFLNREL